MIVLLCGENDFDLRAELARLKGNFDGSAERFDASTLTNEQLADIFAGQSLFALKRLVIIDTPSANSSLWHDLPTWAARLSDDTELILVEPKPDKRTTTFKWLKKETDVREFVPLEARDTGRALTWLAAYARGKGVDLSKQQLTYLIDRAGVDQAELAQAVDKLQLVETIDQNWIDAVVQPSLSHNVFMLFKTVLDGNAARLGSMIASLRQTEDPYRLFGLVTSQLLQLALLVYSDGNVAKVANDTNAKSSFPLQKMAPHARTMTRGQVAQAVRLMADADTRLKSSDADPWLVLESTLVRMASL